MKERERERELWLNKCSLQDLFFAFPWNNFLHYVIYDMLHQVFNGRMDVGLNRNLAISILKDGQLTDKIVIAQKANDEEW